MALSINSPFGGGNCYIEEKLLYNNTLVTVLPYVGVIPQMNY